MGHMGNIVQVIVIILIFVGLYFLTMMQAGMKKLKEDWPKIRCTPTAMPFAGYLGHNAVENFTFCIGNIQKNMMGYFLKPIYYVVSLTSSLGGSIMKSLGKMRQMMSGLREMISSIVGDVFGIFINLIIQFQKIIAKMKDLVMKLIGTTMITAYMMQGAMMTGQSIWRGPIGGTLRAICFNPNTPLKTKSGEIIKMKDIKLGTILENGSKVISTLKILGNENVPYYKIYSKKLGDYIYVTGSHKIQDTLSTKFINVSECKYATKTDIHGELLSCLVTDDHLIPVGEHVFWDWED
jgi:hypothetical protein